MDAYWSVDLKQYVNHSRLLYGESNSNGSISIKELLYKLNRKNPFHYRKMTNTYFTEIPFDIIWEIVKWI